MGKHNRTRRAHAVALVSGGLDSVVAAAAVAAERGISAVITLDYGQRASSREIAAGRAVARKLDAKWHRVNLPWLADLLPPSLANGGARPPRVAAGTLDDMKRASARAHAVWVPNRNGIFLNIAAAFAEACGADSVVAGFNKEEAATFSDNSREFMKRTSAALQLSTRNNVRVVSPTAKLDKTQIVKLGMKLDAPLRLVWSCYEGGKSMCLKCESCERLVRALTEARAPTECWPRAAMRKTRP